MKQLMMRFGPWIASGLFALSAYRMFFLNHDSVGGIIFGITAVIYAIVALRNPWLNSDR